MKFNVHAVELKYNNKNWVDVHDFVGEDNFRFSIGELFIKTRHGSFIKVNENDIIIKLMNNSFEVISEDEMNTIITENLEQESDEEYINSFEDTDINELN